MLEIVSFECEDVSGLCSSVLSSHDDTIATLAVETTQGIYTAALEVTGEVNIEYKGFHYRDVTEFPPELTDLIVATRGDCLFDGSDDDLMCWANNWYEISVFDPDGNYIIDDPPIVEDSLDELGPEGICNEMLDFLEYFLGESA